MCGRLSIYLIRFGEMPTCHQSDNKVLKAFRGSVHVASRNCAAYVMKKEESSLRRRTETVGWNITVRDRRIADNCLKIKISSGSWCGSVNSHTSRDAAASQSPSVDIPASLTSARFSLASPKNRAICLLLYYRDEDLLRSSSHTLSCREASEGRAQYLRISPKALDGFCMFSSSNC